jgi:hypothetical protein
VNDFNLVPFDRDESTPSIEIDSNVSVRGRQLEVSYLITGDLDQIVIPPIQLAPSRQFGLWETTCCEFFIAPVDSAEYWEVNLSPSGDWNVFHLDDYRQGLVEEVKIVHLPSVTRIERDRLTLSTQIELPTGINAANSIDLSITTVIATPTGNISYWAIRHAGSQADFHLRDSFIPINL